MLPVEAVLVAPELELLEVVPVEAVLVAPELELLEVVPVEAVLVAPELEAGAVEAGMTWMAKLGSDTEEVPSVAAMMMFG